jgi:hypothetical protein
MYSDFPVTFMAAWMLTGVDTTPILDQPISKRCGFHFGLPLSASDFSAQIIAFFGAAFLDLNQTEELGDARRAPSRSRVC